MEAGDIVCLELWVVHCFANAFDEVAQCTILVALIREAVHVDHRQIKLACFLIHPHLFICILESTNEAVKEFYSIHWQIHHAVMKLKERLVKTGLLGPLVIFVDEHAQVLPRIHVERNDSLLQLVKLYVLRKVLHTDWIQIVCKHL